MIYYDCLSILWLFILYKFDGICNAVSFLLLFFSADAILHTWRHVGKLTCISHWLNWYALHSIFLPAHKSNLCYHSLICINPQYNFKTLTSLPSNNNIRWTHFGLWPTIFFSPIQSFKVFFFFLCVHRDIFFFLIILTSYWPSRILRQVIAIIVSKKKKKKIAFSGVGTPRVFYTRHLCSAMCQNCFSI